MNGRGLDAFHRADGLGEFAFHRTLVGNLLLEIGGGHAHVVKQRVAAFGRRDVLGAELDPQVVDLVLRHHDRAAAAREFVLHTIGAQRIDHGLRIRRRQARIERGHRGLGSHLEKRYATQGHRNHGDQGKRPLRNGKRVPKTAYPAKESSDDLGH